MRRCLVLAGALYALCFGTCAAADVYPAGIIHDGTMRGVYGAHIGGCCWLAPHASFTVVEPPGADMLLLAFVIPPYALRAAKVHVTVSVAGAPARVLCCFGVGSYVAPLAVTPTERTRDVTVRVSADNVFVPKERGLNQDPRRLTILLQSVTFENTALRMRYVNGVSETMTPAVQAHRGLALALALLAGLATLLLTLWRARFAWLALLISAPIGLAVYVGSTTVTVDKAVLVGAAIGMLCTPHRLRALRSSWFYWMGGAMALVIISMGISTLFAPHLGAAVRATLMAAEYLVALGIAFAAYACDPDESLLRNVLAIETIVVALVAFAQIIIGAPQGEFLFGYAFARTSGLLEGPNQLAGYLGVMLAVPLTLIVLRQSRPIERAALVVGILALLFTLSRGGMLGFAVMVAILLAMRALPTRRALVATVAAIAWGVVALIVLLGAGLWLWHEHAGIGQTAMLYNGGLGTRTELWYAAYALWARHPILGVGPGNFELLVGNMFLGVRTHANSQLLQALCEQGLIGLAALAALITVTLRAFARETRVLGLAAFALVIGFWVHQIFDSLLLYPKVGITYWTLVAIALAGARTIARTAETTISSTTGRKMALPRMANKLPNATPGIAPNNNQSESP